MDTDATPWVEEVSCYDEVEEMPATLNVYSPKDGHVELYTDAGEVTISLNQEELTTLLAHLQRASEDMVTRSKADL